MKETFISAVIPTYNSKNKVIKAVKSLLNQTTDLLEIIVVDNGSSDQTSIKLQSIFRHKIKLIVLQENQGVTGGRNEGVKHLSVKSRMVLFFDHDMIADKKMVEELSKVFETEKKVGIITPKIYYLSDKNIIWSAGTGINLLTGQVLFRGGVDKGQYDLLEPVQVAPAVMLVKADVMKKLKGFDNKYFATFEDTDFCFRANKIGYKTVYAPTAIAFHDLPLDKVGESKRLVKRMYWVGRNRILFMKDFGQFWPIFLLFLIPLSGYYLLLCLKYGSITDYWQFIKGTVHGFLNK